MELIKATCMRKPSKKSGCEEQRCRICLESDTDAKNPLFNPCNCNGDGLVHFNCLKRWLTRNRQKQCKNENVTSFDYENFKCEICTHIYPSTFKDGQDRIHKLIDLSEIKRAQKNNKFLLLEQLPLQFEDVKENDKRRVHLLKVTDDKGVFSVGRHESMDVRISDRTISRLHAIIEYQGDGFYLNDSHSHFGTSILIQDDKKYIENNTMIPF